MGNELAMAIKHKTDAQWRMNSKETAPSTYEGATGIVHVTDPKVYMTPYAAGKNITFGTSGDKTTINAVMNILAGNNISVSAPDVNGAVTITGTILGKEINISDFANKNGYVLTYNSASDKFILAAQSGSLAQATEMALGGIKAKERTTETAEVTIDNATGKLYSQMPSGTTVNNERTSTPLSFWVGTEAQFLEIETPDANTLYFRS